MFSKFAIITLLVSGVCCSPLNGTSSISHGVTDPPSSDIKEKNVKRMGDSVVGHYSVLEPDGSNRIIEYSANPQTGFKAVVKKDPPGVHPLSFGHNGVSSFSLGFGYGGANPFTHGGLHAWNPALNLGYTGYGNGGYGGFGNFGNGWNQNLGLANGLAPPVNNVGSLANGWVPNNGFNPGLDLNNLGSAAAYGATGWANGYSGYNGYGAGNPLIGAHGAHGPAVGW